MMAAHAAMAVFTRRMEGFGHRLYMKNLLFYYDLFSDLYTRK